MTIAHFRLAYTGMHDSQLCIEFLTGKFQNDARAYQIMREDHLFWQVLVSSQTHLIILFIVLYVSTRVLDLWRHAWNSVTNWLKTPRTSGRTNRP